jgi:hypothetical protein
MEFLAHGLKMISNYLKINIQNKNFKMNNNKELSSFEIVNKGYLWVNIPSIIITITIITITVWFVLTAYIEINGKISAIVGGIIGWIYWEFTITKWIIWALNNNVDPDRLLKIGKNSLLLWNNRKIDSILNKRK